MRSVTAKSIHNAALPSSINIPLDANEDQIFRFIRAVCEDIGTTIGKKVVARAVGGWDATSSWAKFPRTSILL